MFTSDKKILQFIDIIKASSTIRFENEFCDAVGVLRQTLYRIRNGKAHFTPDHIEMVCKVYSINANWIIDIEPNMYRSNSIKTKAKFKVQSSIK